MSSRSTHLHLARPFGANPRAADLAAAVAGAVAAAVGIALGELIAGLVPGAPSLVIAIGNLAIDLQPPGAKDVVVDLFGTNDKLALNVLILAVAVLVAAGVGVAGRRRWSRAVVGFGVAALVAIVASLRDPLVTPVLAVLTPVVAVAAALITLGSLLGGLGAGPDWAVVSGPLARRLPDGLARRLGQNPRTTPTTRSAAALANVEWDRRRFLLVSGSIAAGSLAVGALGRWLLENRGGGAAEKGVPTTLPAVADAPRLPPGASLDVLGITPIVMPNDRFYRIDTALLVPRIDVPSWTLTVRGLVDRQVVLTYDQLRAMPAFEQYVTIACVSNKVGDNLVGNAKWTGVHLRDVLSMAGVHPEATQIVGRSVDGFTVGFPTEWAMDPSREPMIALGMNDEILPPEHGYPARLIIPGLYGYVSATKWLSEIELTTLEAFDAYWVRLGWAKEAPILTQSRIDVPRFGSNLPVGQTAIAGVAWAPDRGVSKVEVKVDDGPWQTATISNAISKATWVQWKYDWSATAGSHRIEVRATDGTGVVQTDQVTPPAPDGARGHHHIEVDVG